MTEENLRTVDSTSLDDAYDVIRVAHALGMDTPVIPGSSCYVVLATLYGDGAESETSCLGVYSSYTDAMTAARNDALESATENEDLSFLQRCDDETMTDADIVHLYYRHIGRLSIEEFRVRSSSVRQPVPRIRTIMGG